mmetsp:Transcript_24032/g.25779  ORF Transcript_24032/g.25779 Transcript_24032/m.25779 type:complete len:337 (+) Transcript_24032:46-1056(+)
MAAFLIHCKHLVIGVVAVMVLVVSVSTVDGFARTPTIITPQQKYLSMGITQHNQLDETPPQYDPVSRRAAMQGVVAAALTTILSSPVAAALAEEQTLADDIVSTTPLTNDADLAVDRDRIAGIAEKPSEIGTPSSSTTTQATATTAPQSQSQSSELYSISKCGVSNGKKNPVCISTANVRQLDLYSAPWTFQSTGEEAMARLKSAVEDNVLNTIVLEEQNTARGQLRLLVDSKRSNLGNTRYRMEFLINETDQVITYRSSAPADMSGPDFGLQRKRLDDILERVNYANGSYFRLMGEGLNSADAKSTSEKGYGPLGQLKAFYGLQNGGGFEETLSE